MNSIQPQQMPNQQRMRQTGVGAVEINIINPTSCDGCPPQPNYPVYSQVPTHYYPNINQTNAAAPIAPQAPQPQQDPLAAKPLSDNKTEEKKPADKKPEPKKDVVPLTNEYLIELEKKLNNAENSQERVAGIKEVLKRFKEDDTRKNDPALTNLLNKALRDPSENVKILAMSILDSGYAAGNPKTKEILNQIKTEAEAESDKNSIKKQDAELASRILTKQLGQV